MLPAQALALCLTLAPAQHQVSLLRPGEALAITMGDADPVVETDILRERYRIAPTVGRAHRIEPASSGPFWVDLRSTDFDAYLVLRDAAGAVLAEDDDGLVGTDARLVLERLEAGRSYVVEACALHGLRGSYVIALHTGTPTALSRLERARASVEQLEVRLETLLGADGGDPPGARDLRAMLATALLELGNAEWAEGELEPARASLERCLALRHQLFGAEDGLVAQAELSLGGVEGRLEHFERAEELLRDAVRIREATVGPDHEWAIDDRCTLAELLAKRGADAAAAAEFRIALERAEPALGADHAQTLRAGRGLAGALRASGQEDAALALEERTLATLEAAGDHERALPVLHRLRNAERYDTVRGYLRRRVAALEAAGSGDAELAATWRELGHLDRIAGEPDHGVAAFARALALRAAALGPDHLDTIAAQKELAWARSVNGELEESRRLYADALERLTRTQPESLEVATCTAALAGAWLELGELEEARRLRESALAQYERLRGIEDYATQFQLLHLVELAALQGDRAAEQDSYELFLSRLPAFSASRQENLLQNLAWALRRASDHRRVAEVYERLAALRTELHGAADGRRADFLESAAAERQSLGDLAAARAHLQSAIAAREAAAREDPKALADALVSLGLLEFGAQELRRSSESMQRALEVGEQAGSFSAEDLAGLLSFLAFVDAGAGAYERCALHVDRALGLLEETAPWDAETDAVTLQILSQSLVELGRYEEARPLAQRALELYQRLKGEGDVSTVNPLNVLAQAAIYRGDLAQARALVERAMAALEGGGELADVLTPVLVNNMGHLLLEQGLDEEAERYMARALPMLEGRFGPEHTFVAMAHNNLALLFDRAGRYDEALPHHERALAIWEAGLGPEHPTTALGLNNLSVALRMHGEPQRALEPQRRAAAIWERDGEPTHPRYGRVLQNGAAILRALGRTDEALAQLDRTDAYFAAALPPEHPWALDSLNERARLLLDAGRDGEAARVALDAIRVSTERADDLLWSLTEHERLAAAARLRESLELLLGAAPDSVPERERYEAVLDWKGRASRSLRASRRARRESRAPEAAALLDELEGLQAELSRAVFERDVADRDAHGRRLEELRARRAALEARLVRLPGRRAAPRVALAELGAAVPPDAALVDLVVHRVYARGADEARGEPGGWAPRPRVAAFVLRPGSEEVALRDLGPADALQSAVERFLASLVGARGVAPASAGGGPDAANERLRALLWDPLEPLLGDARLLLVSPDTFLATLPFEVLRDADGRYLVERFGFVYLQDASAITRLPGPRPLEEPSLLVVGGVDFRRRADLAWRDGADAPPAEAEEEGTQLLARADVRGSFADYWGRLQATGAEAEAIAGLHEDAFGEQGERLLLEGPAATEERLKAELPSHAVAHLATHGFFQPEGLTSMWEQVRGEDGLVMEMREPERRVLGMLPGLLSGLVCAGANSEVDARRDDGLLTAEELSWLDLSGVRLVVLSACETGLGSPAAGEGLLGLRRSLRQAGVDTVVSSLWSVQDAVTSELMRDLYVGLWMRGEGRLAALRGAQLELLKRNRIEHGEALPSTWGAFVLSGEWR